MSTEQEKVWKKLAGKELIIGPRVDGHISILPDKEQDFIKDLKSKLDDNYTLWDINTYMNPTTFEPYVVVQIMKTEKK